ncbi:hypothetical protein [Blautia sp.]|uniref:hypothetical protein n=1 Tax=Blautia sp. TaxID=1955243 RepID=UPI00258D2996|nr:hypothetical protein [Blautia sp.]
MEEVRQFTKTFQTIEDAEDFAEKVGGTRDKCTVTFYAKVKYSRATYSVTANKYKIYVRLFPVGNPGKTLTYCVYQKDRQEVYKKAVEFIENGVL